MSQDITATPPEAEEEHVGDDVTRAWGKWKGSCLSCDYWTGYVSERQARKALNQHLKSTKPKIPTTEEGTP